MLGSGNGKSGENKMRNWKPIFVENSMIPIWLSKIAPINIGAIILFFIVFSRGKINEVTRRHETIHFQQMLETGVIGFVVLYFFDYLVGLWKYRDNWKGQKTTRGYQYRSAAHKAYHRIRAEQEAYQNELVNNYPATRSRFSWIKKYKV